MNLIKFVPGSSSTLLENGRPINNWKSVTWVERYLDAGEFKIEAPLSTGLRDFLPIGTLISHLDTLEVMIVEDQQISDDGSDPTITITGRSLDSYLENRIVGQNLARTGSTVVDYTLLADYTSLQATKLINDHIRAASGVSDVNDSLTNVEGNTALTVITGGVVEDRTIKPEIVYAALNEILKIDDLGVKSMRRATFSTDIAVTLATLLRVHNGFDRTSTVHFSWYSGDFDKLEYLFSQRGLKTSAMVIGRWIWTVVDRSQTKYDRRMMLVDASDLDNKLAAAPTGGALTTLIARMQVRGRQALRNQQQVAISGSDVSNSTSYIYRKHYNIGDLVTLDGNYGQILTMRVVEYAEIEDENGYSGHPTLAVPGV